MTEFSLTTYAAIGTRLQVQDFDHPFILTATGEVRDAEGYYAPDAYNAPYSPSAPRDVDVEGDWECVTYGLSGQYSYRGGIMHPSEYIGAGIARHLMEIVEQNDDDDQVFAVVVVSDYNIGTNEDDAIGWTIVRYNGTEGN